MPEAEPENDPHANEQPSEQAGEEPRVDLTPLVGANLRRIRIRKGLSLEKLAKASKVSRAMLGQIELGQSTPTINVLWKIACALDVQFSALITHKPVAKAAVLRRKDARVLTSPEGGFASRVLVPLNQARDVEFYELRLRSQVVERADPHPPGTTENIVVANGALELSVGNDQHYLETGDAVLFEADVPHVYRNPGETDTILYLVMTYARTERL